MCSGGCLEWAHEDCTEDLPTYVRHNCTSDLE